MRKHGDLKLTNMRKNANMKITNMQKGCGYICFKEKYIVSLWTGKKTL